MTNSSQEPRITVLTVTHNSAAVLASLLESIPPDIPLVVVDNVSTDESVAIVENQRPDAQILRNTDNVGYGRGMNTGLAVIETEFVLITSPDVAMKPDSVKHLLACADQFPEAAMIVPQILGPKGDIVISHDVPLHKRAGIGYCDKEMPPEGILCAEFLSGASWLARMEALRDVGLFDPAIFLYYEDDDLCQRLRNAGHNLLVNPNAVFTHMGGGSVPTTPPYTWRKYWHMAWSRLYFERKHRGWLSMMGIFAAEAPMFAIKTAMYALVGNRRKAYRDAARFAGMWAAVCGKSALPKN
jgi:N-acetylglucosaminyl-diphospho-decaprenol L-rhamnosyltransferase